jgi:hypothetical protein
MGIGTGVSIDDGGATVAAGVVAGVGVGDVEGAGDCIAVGAEGVAARVGAGASAGPISSSRIGTKVCGGSSSSDR